MGLLFSGGASVATMGGSTAGRKFSLTMQRDGGQGRAFQQLACLSFFPEV